MPKRKSSPAPLRRRLPCRRAGVPPKLNWERISAGGDTDRFLLEEHVQLCSDLLLQLASDLIGPADCPQEFAQRFDVLDRAMDADDLPAVSVGTTPATSYSRTVANMLFISLNRLVPWLGRYDQEDYAEAISNWLNSHGKSRASRIARREFFSFLGLEDSNPESEVSMDGFGHALLQNLIYDFAVRDDSRMAQ